MPFPLYLHSNLALSLVGSQETNHQLEESKSLAERLNTRVSELEAGLRTAVSTAEELTTKEREASDRVRELVRHFLISYLSFDTIPLPQERSATHSSRTISDLQAELKDQRGRVRELEEQIQSDDRVEVLERRLKSMQDRSEELEEKFNKSKQVRSLDSKFP